MGKWHEIRKEELNETGKTFQQKDNGGKTSNSIMKSLLAIDDL